MCYDINASIKSSIIGFSTSYLLYNYNRDVLQSLALFFAFVTLMQVYDIIFWASLDKKLGMNVNYTFTKVAMITNHLQPIILAYLVNKIIPLNNISLSILFIYSVVALIYSIDAYKLIDYTIVSEESKPSLHWRWNTIINSSIKPEIIYGLFLLSLSVISLQLPAPMNIIMLFVNLFTFIFSLYNYKNTYVGRMWCYIAAYVPILLIGLSNKVSS